jgi:hypothetical protein
LWSGLSLHHRGSKVGTVESLHVLQYDVGVSLGIAMFRIPRI